MEAQTYEDLTRANRIRAVRVRRVLRVQLKLLQSWAATVLLALPISLLWGPGAIKWVGLVYAVVYAATVYKKGGTTHLLRLAGDAIRIAFGKQPVAAPEILGIGLAARSGSGERSRRMPWYRNLIFYGNPAYSLFLSSVEAGFRLNPEGMISVSKEAERISKEILQALSVRDPAVAAAKEEAKDWTDRVQRLRDDELVPC